MGWRQWFRRQNDTLPLTQFITDTVEAIRNSAGAQYDIVDTIKFDLATTVTKSGKGGLQIDVVGADFNYQKETISRVQFQLKPNISFMEQVRKTQHRMS